MKNIFIIILCLLVNTYSFSQNGNNHRDLNWVHGIFGDEGAWESFDPYFSNIFDITTKRVSYSSHGGLDAAGAETLPQLTTESENPFVVAHSMGGLVTRSMHRIDPEAFTGYITFGTPHDGARFANNVLNGDVEAYTTNFIDEVIIEPFAALNAGAAFLSLGWFEYFGTNNPVLLSGAIFGVINNMITNGSEPTDTDVNTLLDLRENGEYVNNLPHPSVPKINYYGVEDSPVHWRFLSSFIAGPGFNTPFGTVSGDDVLPAAMVLIETTYEVGYYTSLAGAVTCGVLSFFNPGCIPEAAYFGNLAYQLNDGINTLQQSEAGWLDLIGCVDFNGYDCQYLTYYTYDYDWDGDVDTDDIMIADSCYRAKLEWEHFNVGDTIKIVIEGVGCEKNDNNTVITYVTNEENDVREEKVTLRHVGPCVPHEIENTYESCVPIFVEADVSDGFIRSGVTEEPDRLEWIKLDHLNHQELKSSADSRTQLKNLFNNEGEYYDPVTNRFGYFHLK